MSYNLHITRAKRWPDSKRHPIGADEWLAVVAADPELTPALNHGPCFVFWNLKKEEKWGPWLNWHSGKIFAKNPEEGFVDKMVEIAKKLNATVQGDDGEYYPGRHARPYVIAESVLEKLRDRLAQLAGKVRWFPRRIWPLVRPAPCDFYVGQKVQDHLGREALVFKIDRRSPTGTAVVSIRYPSGMQVHHVGESASRELKAVLEERPN